MQNKKLVYEDLSNLEIILNEIKLQFFQFTNYLIDVNIVSPFLFRILLIIESIQFIYFSLHPQLKYIWDSNIISTVQNIFGYVQVNTQIIIQIIKLKKKILQILSSKQQQIKVMDNLQQILGLLSYSCKFLSFYGTLVKTIQPLPFFDIFINILLCNQKKFEDITCYNEMYFIQVVITILAIIIQFFFCFIFILLMNDINPFSKVSYASQPNYICQIKLILKILLSSYFALDHKASIQNNLQLIIIFFTLVFLLELYNKMPYYTQNTAIFSIVCEVSLFWISACCYIQGLLKNQGNIKNLNGTLFYLLAGFPSINVLFYNLIQLKNKKYCILFSSEIKKPEDMECYFLILSNLIENRKNRISNILLEGILKIHNQKCKENSEICPCSILIDKSKCCNIEIFKGNEDNEELKWYLFLKSIINVLQKKYIKSAKLNLLNAYIYHEKLKLKFRALTEMMIAETHKSTIKEQFAMVRYRNIIEIDIIDTDMRNEQNKDVDVNGIVHYEGQFVKFIKSLEISVNMHLEFWRELLEESPDVEKLQIIGSRITYTIEDVQQCYSTLCLIRQNNIRSLLIYGYFVKNIINNEIMAQEYFEQAAYISKSAVVTKQLGDNQNMKYNENSNTGILLMSANISTKFYVQNTNYDFTRILGWPKQEIINQNIKNYIMPKLIQSIHDNLVSNYIETSIPKAIGFERLITPVNKDGFIIPCLLMIKILPNLEEGLQFVGFFKEIDEIYCSPYKRNDDNQDQIYNYLIYKVEEDKQNQVLVGITQGCYQNFGIPTSLINNNSPMSNQFTIDLICPQIIQPEILLQMSTNNGAQITMDTTIIGDIFLISQQSLEDNLYSQNNLEVEKDTTFNFNQNKYKKAQINVWLEEEFVYQVIIKSQQNFKISLYNKKYLKTKKQTKIHIIKFIESDQQVKIILSDQQNLVGQTQYQKQTQEQSQIIQIEKKLSDNKNLDIKNKDDDQSRNPISNNNENQKQVNLIDENNYDQKLSSNFQQNESEEIRQLKDIKSSISQYKIPKSIKNLQISVGFIFLSLIIITSSEFIIKSEQQQAINDGIEAVYSAFNTNYLIAEVNFITRKIWLISNGYENQNKQIISKVLQNLLDQKIQILNQLQQDVVKAKINIERRQGYDINTIEINTQVQIQFYIFKYIYIFIYIYIYIYIYIQKKILSNGTTINVNTNYTDAINFYIAQSGGLANSTLTDFIQLNQNEYSYTQQYFYYVNQNGLFSIRQGAEQLALIYNNFYISLIDNFFDIFMIIMIIAIFLITFSLIIIIPIIINVQKSSYGVLGFFAAVPIKELEIFANKCDEYIKTYIERKNIQNKNRLIINSNTIQSNNNNISILYINNENSNVKDEINQKEQQSLIKNNTINTDNMQQINKNKLIENNQQENEENQKNLVSKNNKKQLKNNENKYKQNKYINIQIQKYINIYNIIYYFIYHIYIQFFLIILVILLYFNYLFFLLYLFLIS
ncbi:PAS domain S-box family protein [Ichthyophthirius multifiliis]|uniref:PAS domain S-box family protein n=1 Tax=Ichthyophthirius multifiliis TaxID=5932 RepID=G0QS44_ICHMU|nr:PAS domain S-box family protein [Ichthyophthirius multifiliis]EGR31957.1 PAS domain S-box family protein [Ichthyophthirius multifiliis]|eukprot:XP_004035443.1 PAS domain S-box family protein [Ichthyophthirius multifiliis]